MGKRVIVRIRNPHDPREVLIATREGRTLSLFESLTRKELVELPTAYEKAMERVRRLEAQKADLLKRREELLATASTGLATGRPVAVKTRELNNVNAMLHVLERSLEEARQQAQAAEAEHLKTMLERLAERRREVEQKLEPERRAWEKAQEAYRRAEQRWQEAYAAAQAQLSDLRREEEAVRARLLTIEPQEAPRHATRTVEEWLNDFRAGKVTLYLAGQDENADAAYQRYEQERAALEEWARRDALSRRTNGTGIEPPDFAKHWPKRRVDEIRRRLAGAVVS